MRRELFDEATKGMSPSQRDKNSLVINQIDSSSNRSGISLFNKVSDDDQVHDAWEKRTLRYKQVKG